ncbi:DUF1972 domain-containing protein [Paraflavitalea pollutisoli]|uniref:DUF1972 domain-containing protein n=1 Tax=Paraflavitalea pollutisoli TaxID=3034143 RepID=UPI0023ECCD30|nr:DUF1972 domain-containing protein [Paraflavitalea sp. H1-2-19X]
MKIAIIGTRGIPNKYGGFEQFAEFIAPALVQRGHEVFVYNSSLHPFQESTYKGVQLIRKADPENKVGTFGQFIYDLNCILDSRKREFDIILQLGYTSSSVWSFLFPKKAVIITNMDGLEWKRSKYPRPVQQFLKRAEKWAALGSDKLIADSKGIQSYLLEKYQKPSAFIAYGASLFTNPNSAQLAPFGLTPYNYNLLIARMEPENNIETILQGHHQAETRHQLILIGNHSNKFGTYLKNKYETEHIRFIGPVYDLQVLNDLRHFSHLYFHGHSVGGTNPSLLEAMASQSLIVANDNIFNKTVLEQDAFYFSSPADIAMLLDQKINKSDFGSFLQRNNEKIVNDYSWEYITNTLEKYLTDALSEQGK